MSAADMWFAAEVTRASKWRSWSRVIKAAQEWAREEGLAPPDAEAVERAFESAGAVCTDRRMKWRRVVFLSDLDV